MNFYKACQRKDYLNSIHIFETLSESQRSKVANTKILIHTHPIDEYEWPVFMFHSVRWYELLLRYVNVNIRSLMAESTLLMNAICRKDVDEVSFLVDKGADVNACVNGTSPLAVVIDRVHDFEMFDIILKGKPSFDVRHYRMTTLSCLKCGSIKRYCDSLHCLITDHNMSREQIEIVVMKAFAYYARRCPEKITPRIATMYFASVLRGVKLSSQMEDFAEMLVRDYGVDGDILCTFCVAHIFGMNLDVSTGIMIAYNILTIKFMKVLMNLALACRLRQFKLFLALGYREPIEPKDVISSNLSIELYELISGVYDHFDISEGIAYHKRMGWSDMSHRAYENRHHFLALVNPSLRQLSYHRVRSLNARDGVVEMKHKILEVQHTKNWRLLLE